MHSPPGPETVLDGRRYLYFAGTGYLGLQGHQDVILAACEATRRYGVGSATSRPGFGNTPPTLDVERRAAEFFAADDAFYFTSGYFGNNVLVLFLDGSFDAVFADELSHYCVLEAARLSGRPLFRFPHRDAEGLAASLRDNLQAGQRPLVMTDGVFTARGTIAPVDQYADVLANYGPAAICVDDAHGVGVLGECGRGTYEYAGLFQRGVNTRPPDDTSTSDPTGLYWCGTLSKAIGGFGGILPGSQRFIDRLKATSTYYRGASAPPIPAAAATARALELVIAQPQLRSRLHQNVATLKQGLRNLGLDTDDTPVPIICLTIGTADNMRRIQSELRERGIIVAYMATYSGLGADGALRVAVFASHTDQMIQRLLDELKQLL